MEKLDHPGIPVLPCCPSWLTDEGYSHQAFSTFGSPFTRTHTHMRRQYSIKAVHNPVRQMNRLQTRTFRTSKRQSGRAAEREEKGWAVRERERDLTSALPSPSLLQSFFKTNAQSSSREKYQVLGRRLHLLLWGFIWVLSCPVCVRVCMCVGGRKRRLVWGMKDMGRCRIAPRI